MNTHFLHKRNYCKVAVANIPDGMVSMKVIVYPGSRTDEFVFSEDCTIQNVRQHIAELLQFIGSRSPNPNTFRMWQIHPQRELAKPLLTLRQMQVPRECALLVMPPDMTPPRCSNLAQLDQVLSSLNFNSTQNNRDDQRSNQGPAKAPKRKSKPNSKSIKKESVHRANRISKKDKKEKTKKPAPIDERFVESTQYYCTICLKIFGSKRAVRAHHTRIHKASKDTPGKVGESWSAVPVKAGKRIHEEPKKNRKVNRNDITINLTITNTVNYNYVNLRRGDFF